MAFIDAIPKQRNLSRRDLSEAIGRHPYYLAVAAGTADWHPRRQAAEAIAAKLEISVRDLLAYTPGTWEDWLAVNSLAARLRLYARQAARAANNWLADFLRDFLVAQVRELAKRGDNTELEALRERLTKLPLKRHPNSDIGGRWTRGKPKDPRSIDKMLATKSERGLLKTPPFLDFNRSAEGRVLLPLWAFLRYCPQPRRKQAQEWARRTAARLNTSAAVVIATWKPHLEKHGLWSKAGRKANEERHELVDQLIGAAVRTATGRLPRGFWESAAAEVSKREGKYISGPELRVWYDQHRHRYCLAAIT